MPRRNFWPDISSGEIVRSPRAYLRGQADQLTEMTNGLLRGETTLDKSSGYFSVALNVVVPNLNSYRYTVLVATYNPVLLYPVTLEDFANEATYERQSQEEFLELLAQVLSSDGVRRVLLALLSQARESPAEDEIPF